ncbi:hypothetical protein KCU88_g467, partial [Aureobasidium melanogenum]
LFVCVAYPRLVSGTGSWLVGRSSSSSRVDFAQPAGVLTRRLFPPPSAPQRYDRPQRYDQEKVLNAYDAYNRGDYPNIKAAADVFAAPRLSNETYTTITIVNLVYLTNRRGAFLIDTLSLYLRSESY